MQDNIPCILKFVLSVIDAVVVASLLLPLFFAKGNR